MDVTEAERLWAQMKYAVLAKNQGDYLLIRRLFRERPEGWVATFLHLLEENRAKPENTGNEINAAQHVFGYYKNVVTSEEKRDFLMRCDDLLSGKTTGKDLRLFLAKLQKKHPHPYLADSYYFKLEREFNQVEKGDGNESKK